MNTPQRRTFTVPPPEGEGPEFDLAWTQKASEGEGDEAKTRTFRCLPRVPAGLIRDHLDSNSGSRVQSFIVATLQPAHQSEFEKLIRDKDALIDGETLGEIFIWLMEVYTGRNFTRPPDSSDGPSAADEAS